MLSFTNNAINMHSTAKIMSLTHKMLEVKNMSHSTLGKCKACKLV